MYMNKKLKKVFKIILLIIILTVAILLTHTLLEKKSSFADSGFDASYDSGGGFDSGSSYSGSDGDGEFSLPALILTLLIFGGLALAAFLSDKHENKKTIEEERKARQDSIIIEQQLQQIIPGFNKDQFLYDCFKMYSDIQMGWMNFNLESVRHLLSDELYSMYSSQLATLQTKGEQNIMGQFILHDSLLTNYIIQNGTITITARFVIELYDFIINQATNTVLRGSPTNKIFIKYEMNFRKSLNENNKVTKCPTCGAEIEMNSGEICSYCHSKLVTENTNWVLTDKKNLSQSYYLGGVLRQPPIQ